MKIGVKKTMTTNIIIIALKETRAANKTNKTTKSNDKKKIKTNLKVNTKAKKKS